MRAPAGQLYRTVLLKNQSCDQINARYSQRPMPLNLLLHLSRGRADREAELAAAALKPAHINLTFTLRRVPTIHNAYVGS